MTGTTPPLQDVDQSWPVVRTEDLHRDDWVMALRADWVTSPTHPDGEPFRRLVLEHPGAAVVLAVDDEEHVVCVVQYRHPARRRFIELPAGLCDAEGEDPLEVAKRELQEEVQLAAEEWTHLTSAYSSPGISAELIHYYLARGLSDLGRGDFELAHEEADMELVRVPFADLLDAVLAGRISDAPVIIAVLTAHTRGLVGARP
ncbi:ADP-ribose pyrophosphatase [Nocardioides terrae]|uniref:ADP-ribose pyrophosphatase n=1 Tax=Nocardioides terrae TaxID=574651 RepID=A0A1I1NQA4_9ACTN|nr:NUDIX hydrolase [Nocardioides terrae]SFC99615.1 ADP-ribose pyrophosphatase [Nocardioides terrae]